MAGFDRAQSSDMKKTPIPRLLLLAALSLPSAAMAQRGDPNYLDDKLNSFSSRSRC
jgi:hypothetical protein